MSLKETKRSMYPLLWLTVGFVCAGIEAHALSNKKKGDTLSQVIRKAGAVNKKPPYWRLRRLVLLIVLAWLPIHLLTGSETEEGWV